MERTLRLCILAFLKLARNHNTNISRRCNTTWCNSLIYLSADRLISRLKYILWWAPLRVIATAYNRGIFRGQRVLTIVFEELQRRGVEDAPSVRQLRNEIQLYRQLLEASSDEETALIEETRAVEEQDLWRRTQPETDSETSSEIEHDDENDSRSDDVDRIVVAVVETARAVDEAELIQHTSANLSESTHEEEDDDDVVELSDSSDDENVSTFNHGGTEQVAPRKSPAEAAENITAGEEEVNQREANNELQPLAIGEEEYDHRENQLCEYPIEMEVLPGEEVQQQPHQRADEWYNHLMIDDSEIQKGGGRTRQPQPFIDIQPPGNRIDIINDTARYFKRFQLRGRETTIRIREPPTGTSVMGWLEGAFNDLLTHITNTCEGGDYVGISFSASNLSHGPVWLSFRPARDYEFQDIWQLITSVAQSAESFNIDDECTIKTCIVKGVEGAGRRKGLTHEAVAKKSILTIRNDDNLCLPRSLAAGLIHAERGELRTGTLHTKWQKVRQINGTAQKTAALELTRRANVIIPKAGCGINEIVQYQDYLAREGIAIVVFEFLSLGRRKKKSLFNGTQSVLNTVGEVRHTLYILYYERSHHFQPILNLRGAVGSTGFCVTCDTLYRTLDHRCIILRCSRCRKSPPCDPRVSTIKCAACNRIFFGETCFRNHRWEHMAKEIPSICSIFKSCPDCFATIRVRSQKKHVCGVGYCKTCKVNRPYNHLCYMMPLKKKGLNNNLFIFYDFETQQCKSLEGTSDTYVHEPNLCVAQKVCTNCCDNESIAGPCEVCGVHEFVFKHQPVAQLVELALRDIEKFTRTIVIAHNAGGFDAQFILRYLIEEKKTQLPELIMNGTKIISMRLEELVFLDSLHYFHMPLSKLPKSFGLTATIAKGIFPHLFNRPENQYYVGELPSTDYYSPDSMPANVRNNIFEPWYHEMKNSNYVFDFQKEIIDYCKNDVTILRQACMVFRKMFIAKGSVCPFDEGTTIASACFKIFRKNFLEENAIGIIPRGGYRWADNQSKKAVSWLVWMEHILGQRIIHAGRSREFKLPQNLSVDGYYEVGDTTYVLQFHGCYWHGCPRCFLVDRDLKEGSGTSLNQRLERTTAIAYKIRNSGYVLQEIWECVYDSMLDANAQMRTFVKNHPLVISEPLNSRDAFFGGRTENMVTLYDIKDNEQIRYVDVCSLYPYICKYGKYPVGHPKVYVGDECMELTGPNNDDLTKVEGLVKCTVLPPRNLYHPVLPVRMHKRLLFALCRSCSESMSQDACTHENPADRMFDGTWVVDELRKAVACGYKVIRVEEIWQYEITQYNRETRSGGHFTEYINTFLKIKQESSGWPTECVDNEEAQEQYIADFERAEGIKLDRAAITKNPGLRQVAKLCLNSFWGKFGQRENLPQPKNI